MSPEELSKTTKVSSMARMGIPVKLNAHSERKPNGIPG
jgi:hypothetical protein